MSDNELDNLFKEAAEGYNAPKDPSAWDAMSKRLDSAGVGTSAFWNWKTISVVSVVGIIGIGSLVFFRSSGSESLELMASGSKNSGGTKEVALSKPADVTQLAREKNLDANVHAIEDKEGTKSELTEEKYTSFNSSKINSKGGVKGFNDVNTIQKKSAENQPADNNDAIVVQNDNQRSQSGKNNIIERSTEISDTSDDKVTAIRVSEPSADKNIGSNQVVSAAGTSQRGPTVSTNWKNRKDGDVASESNVDGKKSEPISALNNVAMEKKANEPEHAAVLTHPEATMVKAQEASAGVSSKYEAPEKVILDSVGVIDSVTVAKKSEVVMKQVESSLGDEQDKQNDAKKKSRGFALKLAVAPDYSAVGGETPSGLGYGFGLLVEYRLSGHWSIATGGIWEKKIYSAKDMEYNGYKADRVDGDCRMWDIPVNVYYSFAPSRRLSLYTGFGFSSYIMNKESYVLYYDGTYGSYDYPVAVKGKNNEWFKMLNLSVGVQMQLNEIISLQVEPTLKAPLAGVGEGKVSLLSLGAFFNVRFNIPNKK